MVLRETYERERCSFNLIAYGVPESTSSISQLINHDMSEVINILGPLGDSIQSSMKLLRLGKANSDAKVPLKLMYDSKELATRLFAEYKLAKYSGTSFLEGFRLARDKTFLERKLLRDCHKELDSRIKNYEFGLRILFNNGLPVIGFAN